MCRSASRHCCERPDIHDRDYEGTTAPHCMNCGLYQWSPLGDWRQEARANAVELFWFAFLLVMLEFSLGGVLMILGGK